jgi:zinc transport system permease protein
MIWPFELQFMQLALAAGLVVGACAPLVGAFLVHKRLSLLGDGIGHMAFAGVAAGLLLNIAPLWTALAAAVLGALMVERLRRMRVAAGDLALALLFYGGIAGGVVLSGLAGSLNASMLSYLFGAVLTVTPGDIWTIAGIGGLILIVLAVTGRALFSVLIDEESARVAGLPVDALNALLAVLAAVTVVIAMRVVGILLVAALMVLPVGASQAFARSFRTMLAGASALGVVSVVAGLSASRAWNLAPGGAIVLTAAVAFAAASLLGGRVRRRNQEPHAVSPHTVGVGGAAHPGASVVSRPDDAR